MKEEGDLHHGAAFLLSTFVWVSFLISMMVRPQKKQDWQTEVTTICQFALKECPEPRPNTGRPRRQRRHEPRPDVRRDGGLVPSGGRDSTPSENQTGLRNRWDGSSAGPRT